MENQETKNNKLWTAEFVDDTKTSHYIDCEGNLVKGLDIPTFDSEQSAKDAIAEFCNGDKDLERKCWVSEYPADVV